MKLPTRLGKEPLVDAVFEIRFASELDASDVLPGVLHATFKGNVKIERLPASALPKELRDQDPNLTGQPLVAIHRERFSFFVGSKSLGLVCKMPYPGWALFQAEIMDTLRHLSEANIATAINRYSMKYVDLLESDSPEEGIGRAELAVRIGQHTLSKETFQLNIHVVRDPIVHLIQIGAPATAKLPTGVEKRGLLVSIDSVVNTNKMPFTQFMNGIEGRLSKLHAGNKAMFFECLKPSTVKYLEPTYE